MNKTAVVGLGISGVATIRWLHERGTEVVALDTRAQPPGLAELPAGVPCRCGPLDEELLKDCQQIVLSPGLSLKTPAIAAAMAAGVEVIGDVELFARHARAPVIAITGSNGKSTVTSLVGEMARAAGVKVAVGGNIGVPVLALPEDAELYVLELSSFQLETTHSLHCRAATLLNLSPDHLDRYQGMADYRDAKLRIFKGCETAVYNRDDLATRPPRGGTSFGLDVPEAGQYGIRDGHLAKGERLLLPVSELRILGRHNQANTLAALALGEAAGLPLDAMLAALKGYQGLPHRCEWVADRGGVTWVNDSKATNLGSTEAALDGFAGHDGQILLLAGGDAKGADLSPLAGRLDKVRRLIAFGKDGAALAALTDKAELVDSLDAAVALAARLAKPGDLVLLSPACASLDQFKSFEARGQRFRELVEALP
ncbi:UDP-N-acetylmuramoyl-L-alanine--D-glutamate ligase [Gallaecimonas sp. GXIMD4217]|uniref:UDP-N-acetylmuramoyl-L-alanine--D-glutamate ligase n=1 Tax=Gallaecimonas sp. GXIMD4217 TaxID=3131927 RepID=UPI00311B0561